jgi:O-antigen/teichoic acid export membrane protein
MGLSRLVTREVAASMAKDDLPHLFGVVRWTNRMGLWLSAAMVLAVVAAGLVVAYNKSTDLGITLILAAPIIPLMTLTRINGGVLQGLHHIVRGQIPQNLVRPLFFSALLIVVYLAGASLQPSSAMGLNVLSAAIALAACYAWLRRRLPKGAPDETVRGGRRWLASTIPMALTDGMRILQTELSVLIVGLLTAPTAVGLFRIANITAMMAAGLTIAIGHVGLSVIAKLHAEGDRVRLQMAVTALARAQVVGTSVLTIPLLVAPEFLIRLAFGEPFEPAATTLQIFAAGQLLNAMFGTNVILLTMTNHERRVTRATAIAFALNLVLIPLLLPLWGIDGAAVAVVASMLCWNIILWRDASSLLGIETAAVFRSAFERFK